MQAIALLLVGGWVGVVATNVFADTIILDATDAANGPLANGSAAINTTTAEAAIGSGAWQANGTAASQYYLYNASTNDTAQRGLGQLTVGNLASISFSTYLSSAEAAQAPNWYILIYTAPYTGGEASWYGNRLILEPYLSHNYNNPGNQWVTFSTDPGNNQLGLVDTALAHNQGFYGEPTLAEIQSGAFTWSSYTSGGSATPINYSAQEIMGIVLSTGSAWANGFTGMVDDVNINTTSGNVKFDLEAAPVPEPSTLALAALGGLALFLKLGTTRKSQRI